MPAEEGVEPDGGEQNKENEFTALFSILAGLSEK